MGENTNNIFVVDASFVLAYLYPDEESSIANDFFERYVNADVECISTDLLPFEVLNSIRVGLLRKRLSKHEALKLADQFLHLHIKLEQIDFRKIITIAIEANISVYDAAYVALAKGKRIPLLTLDARLNTL